MPLTKPNQQLRRDLKEAAALLKWAGVDLYVVSKRMMAAGDEQGAMELMKIAMSFQLTEDNLAGYADEVKAGQITRARQV
ncbi:hypothetical protein M2397_000550 [Pseudomonas sp. BIGb0381]|uniref:hypothetical protein n=1 Tax=Pseudomonas sp. BIGb0381 TaxID=2940608 RepID=UPI002168BD62|nr:hypothetical protein [Pseudomonas sp. BIGb0381]MCS4310275.1 hypothetical protein [Pseudomonas sp. BIGb0381]